MLFIKSTERLGNLYSLAHARLRRIADLLYVNAGLNDNPGLLNGKMGIAIFLYHYARRTRCEMYETYAGELIDEIYKGISTQTPPDFTNGLTGIGWGIEHLVRNGFVEADTDEALAEIDNAIYTAWLKRPVLSANPCDLSGYGFYWLARLQNSGNHENNLSTLGIKQHLIYLIDEYEMMFIHQQYTDSNFLSPGISTMNSIAWFILEMFKLGFAPLKAGNLLYYLASSIKFCLQKLDDWAGNYVLWHIVNNIIPLISDKELEQEYRAIAKLWVDKNLETKMDDDSFVNNFGALSWQKLVYSPYLKEYSQLEQIGREAFKIIDDEENWDRRLDKLNKDNLGLTGLAGLGLGLMNEII